MKYIYRVTESTNYGGFEAYFTDKEKAEKYVAENNKPWTNKNGITWNTVTMEAVQLEDFHPIR